MNDDMLHITEPRPTRSDAVRNRETLLETADRLFRERGVEAVSMTAIADEAGVGKGTLYRHFTDKADLCQALLDADQRNLQERTLTRLRGSDDPVADIRWFVGEVLKFVLRNAEYLGDGQDIALAHPAHQWWRQTIRGLLEKIQPTGDLDYIADMLYVMLDARTIIYQQQTHGYDETRIHDGIITTLLCTISR